MKVSRNDIFFVIALVAAIATAIAIGYFLCEKSHKPEQKTEENPFPAGWHVVTPEERIDRMRAEIKIYAYQDSLKSATFDRQKELYKAEIKRLKAQIIRDPYKLRGGYATNSTIIYGTKTLRISIDSATYYGQLNKRDSVIAYQDSTISSLETDRHFSKERTAEQLDFLKKAYVDSENYSSILESKLAKAERKAGQNITVGPYVGAAYDLGSGGFRPSVGVSAQFKVFGFRVGKKK